MLWFVDMKMNLRQPIIYTQQFMDWEKNSHTKGQVFLFEVSSYDLIYIQVLGGTRHCKEKNYFLPRWDEIYVMIYEDGNIAC